MRESRIVRTCRSFEKNWRSPQRNHWQEPVTAMRRGIDERDAWLIEQAWATLPDVDRIILRAHFCFHWSPAHICRVVHREAGLPLRPHRLPLALEHSKFLLQAALQRSISQNHNMVREYVQKVLALVFRRSYA
jgi:hypothetical protein